MNFNVYYILTQIIHKKFTIINSRLSIINKYAILIYATALYKELERCYDIITPIKSLMMRKI